MARRLAYQRGQVCQERLAIEFPAVPAALPAPECHVPRSPFRREATITARAAHRNTARDIRARRTARERPGCRRRRAGFFSEFSDTGCVAKPGHGPTGRKLTPGIMAGHGRGLPAPGGLHFHQ